MDISNKYSGLSALLPVVQAEKDYVMNSKKVPPDQVPAYLMNRGLPQLGAAVADKIALDNAAKMQPNPQVPPAPPTVVEANRMAAQKARLQQVMNGRNNEMMQLRDTTGLAATNIPPPVSPQGMAAGGIVAFAAGDEVQDDFRYDPDYAVILQQEIAKARAAGDMRRVEELRRAGQEYMRRTGSAKMASTAANVGSNIGRTFFPNLYNQNAAGLPSVAPAQPAPTAAPAASAEPFGVIMPDTRAELDAAMRRSAEPPRRAAPATQAAPAAPAKPKEDQFSKYERPTPKDEATLLAETEARQKREKTGAYSQADADLAAFIKEQKDKGGDEKTAYKNFWVMTGASLLANRSPFFTQALGESVKDNYGNLIKDLKQLKDDSKALRLQEIQLLRAQEQAKETNSKDARDRAESLRDKYDATGIKIAELRSGIEQKVLDRANERTIAQLRQYGNERMADQLIRMWDEAQAEKDPVKQKELMARYQARLAEANTIISQTTAGGIGATQRDEAARRKAVADVMKSQAYVNDERIANSSTRSEDEKKQARARMQRRIDEARDGGDGPRERGYVPESGSIRNPIDFTTLPR